MRIPGVTTSPVKDSTYDLIVIGGGVLGTFYAFHAVRRGLKTVMIERDTTPRSATVQNFGQVLPSGMNLKWQTFGRKSLEIYHDIQSKFDITVSQNGSIYIASDDDELKLLEELHEINKHNDYHSQLLTARQCLKKNTMCYSPHIAEVPCFFRMKCPSILAS